MPVVQTPAPMPAATPAPAVAPVSVAPASAPVAPSGDSPLKKALAQIGTADLLEAEETGEQAARADMLEEVNAPTMTSDVQPIDFAQLVANLDKAGY